MKIRLKTLKNEIFQVDVDPSNTISQLKEAIYANRQDFTASSGVRLIFAGTQLDDAVVLSSLNLKGDEFFVCMGGKKVAAPAATAVSPEKPKISSVTAPPAAATMSTTTVVSEAVAAPMSEGLQNLIAMTGFPEAACRQALDAANGDPNLAFDFLQGYAAMPAPAARRAHGNSGGNVNAHVAATVAAPAPSPLDRIRQHPQFEQLKQIIRSNPQALTSVIAIINQSDPQLSAAINENHADFVRIMNEPPGPAPSSVVMPPHPPAGHGHGNGHVHNFQMDNENFGEEGDEDDEEGNEENLDLLAAQMGTTREQLIQALVQQMQNGDMAGGDEEGEYEELSEADNIEVNNIVQNYGFAYEDVADCYLHCNRDVNLTIQTLFEEGEEGAGGEGDYDDEGDV